MDGYQVEEKGVGAVETQSWLQMRLTSGYFVQGNTLLAPVDAKSAKRVKRGALRGRWQGGRWVVASCLVVPYMYVVLGEVTLPHFRFWSACSRRRCQEKF